MQKALHIRTTVLPGGKMEIVDKGLRLGRPLKWLCVTYRRRNTIMRIFALRMEVNACSPQDIAAWHPQCGRSSRSAIP